MAKHACCLSIVQKAFIVQRIIGWFLYNHLHFRIKTIRSFVILCETEQRHNYSSHMNIVALRFNTIFNAASQVTPLPITETSYSVRLIATIRSTSVPRNGKARGGMTGA